MVTPDPRFPNRPTHPDFSLLSASAIDNDALAESGEGFEKIVGSYADPGSIEYIAIHRAAMAFGATTPLESARIAGAILDGFLLGCAYMQRRTTQEALNDLDEGGDNT